VKKSRTLFLIALLIVVAAASWWFLSRREQTAVPSQIPVSYTEIDGKTQATWPVSMRPQQPSETATEHLHNAALFAAVAAVAGPPADVEAVRFPPGTRVNSVTVNGTTATVDLSGEVAKGVGGTFGENGEFKALVYTLTALPGIDAVQVTVEGRKLATLPGGNVELDQPLRRSDF
jgi:spore germination protein GerM